MAEYTNMKLGRTALMGLDIMQVLYLNPYPWAMEGLRDKITDDEVSLKRVLKALVEQKYVYFFPARKAYCLTVGAEMLSLHDYLKSLDEVVFVGPNSTHASDRCTLTLNVFLRSVKLKDLFEGDRPIPKLEVA